VVQIEKKQQFTSAFSSSSQPPRQHSVAVPTYNLERREYKTLDDSTHDPFKGSRKVLDASTLEINEKQISATSKR